MIAELIGQNSHPHTREFLTGDMLEIYCYLQYTDRPGASGYRPHVTLVAVTDDKGREFCGSLATVRTILGDRCRNDDLSD